MCTRHLFFADLPFQTHDPTNPPTKNKNCRPIPNPTHGSTQPTDNSDANSTLSVSFETFGPSINKAMNHSPTEARSGPDLSGGGLGRRRRGQGGRSLRYTPKKSRKIFFPGKHNVKFGHFLDICCVKFRHFVNFSYIISGKNVFPPPNLTELLPYAWARLTWVTRWETVNILGLRIKD